LSDNEVFNSGTPSPSFHAVHSEVRLRRATVGCELSTGMQSCFSTGDIPSLVDQETRRKSRPKSFFPYSGKENELMNWKQLWKSDSSDLEDAVKAGTFLTLLNTIIADFCVILWQLIHVNWTYHVFHIITFCLFRVVEAGYSSAFYCMLNTHYRIVSYRIVSYRMCCF